MKRKREGRYRKKMKMNGGNKEGRGIDDDNGDKVGRKKERKITEEKKYCAGNRRKQRRQ